MKIRFELTPIEVSEAQHCSGVRGLIARLLSEAFAYGAFGRGHKRGEWKVELGEGREEWLKCGQVELLFNRRINYLLDHDLEILQMKVVLADGREIGVDDLWDDGLWGDEPTILDELDELDIVKNAPEPELTEHDKEMVYASVKRNAKYFKGGSVEIEIVDVDGWKRVESKLA